MPTNAEYLSRRLWAKTEPFHYLWRHLLDAAAVAEALLPRFVPDGTLPLSRLWLCYLVALHDLGKADPLFQFKAEEYTDWSRLGFPAFIPRFAARVDFAAWEAAGLNSQVNWDNTRGFRHEARSYEWLLNTHLPAKHGWGKDAARVAATAIRGHHADFDASCDTERVAVADRWDPLRESLSALVADAIGLDAAAPQDFAGAHASRVGLILSGLIVLSDWIASNEKLFRYETITHLADPREYFAAARGLAQAAVKSLHFDAVPAAPDPAAPAFRAVWTGDDFKKPRPTQVTLEEAVLGGRVPPGLAIIEAPMGEGKTEAAIYLAEVWNRATGRVGTYIALPTQATSNQMFGRYDKFLRDTRPELEPRLLHGMAWLREPETDENDTESVPETDGPDGDAERNRAAEWFFDNAKRGLLALESVGTVDQALFAALNVRHGFLRLFGLSARTLIVDEAHAYDDFMTAILCRLLRWLHALRVPTVLLSATLSRRQKEKLLAAWDGARLPPLLDCGREAYPLITLAPFDAAPKSQAETIAVTNYDRKSTVTLRVVPGALQNDTATAKLAASLVATEGGCLCVIVNTVAQAQAVFKRLEAHKEAGDLPPGCDLLLFHARFPAKRRDEIERDVIRKFGKAPDGQVENPEHRPRCAILVATQVVEQSLDVDFDAMLSELAPIDLLLQRSGRLHRHGGRDRPAPLREPVLYVLAPEAGDYDLKDKATGNPTGTSRVYQPYILLRTLALLTAGGNEWFVFHTPGGFRDAIESVYAEDAPAPEDATLADAIAATRDSWTVKEDKKKHKAKIHLIAEPDEEEFSFAEIAAVDEDAEGELPPSYLRARTRDDDGEPSRSVLILTEPDDHKAWVVARKMTGNSRPPKWVVRQLFLCKASVPARWINGVPNVPVVGMTEPRWLQGHAVLEMKKSELGLFRFEYPAGIIRLWSDGLRGLYEEKANKPSGDGLVEVCH